MSGPVLLRPRRPPPMYRIARALRRASIVVLVLLILFTLSVVYSTVQLTNSAPRVSSFSAAFAPNGTVVLAGNLTITNPGFYPIQALSVEVRVVNDTQTFLGAFGFGPITLASQGSAELPVTLYLPVSATSPGASLLVQTQYIGVSVWGNATFGYLFPALVSFHQNRSWGAPFDHLAFSVGTPTLENGTAEVPVQISFQNEASITEAGQLHVSVVASDATVCGSATWSLNVGPGAQYSQTQSVPIPVGCSPSGGHVTAEYVTPGYTVPLPPEPIP
jgi:hypothetical protein